MEAVRTSLFYCPRTRRALRVLSMYDTAHASGNPVGRDLAE